MIVIKIQLDTDKTTENSYKYAFEELASALIQLIGVQTTIEVDTE